MKKTFIIFVIILILSGASYIGVKQRTAPPKELEVHFIDVGQRDAILIRTINGKNMLIDSGSREYAVKVLDYLHEQGIGELDIVVATHPDEDHIGAMSEVIKKIKIDAFYMPDKVHNTIAFEQMIDMLKNRKVSVFEALAGNYLYFDEGVDLLVLNPGDRIYTDNNNYSIVLKLIYGTNSFLFTGDIDAVNEYALISDFGDLLDSDILKLAHHGSSGSSAPEFIDAVSPVAAVVSAGIGNSYGHPHQSVSRYLQARGVPLYRTDEQGSIVFYSDGQNIRVNCAEPGSYR